MRRDSSGSNAERGQSRWTWWTLGLITAVGILARVLFLFSAAGYDEAYSYLMTQTQVRRAQDIPAGGTLSAEDERRQLGYQVQMRRRRLSVARGERFHPMRRR